MRKLLSLVGTLALLITGVAGYTKAGSIDTTYFDGSVSVVSVANDLRLSLTSDNFESKTVGLENLEVKNNNTPTSASLWAKNAIDGGSVEYYIQLGNTLGMQPDVLKNLTSEIVYRNVTKGGDWVVAKAESSFIAFDNTNYIMTVEGTDVYEIKITVKCPVKDVPANYSRYSLNLVEKTF